MSSINCIFIYWANVLSRRRKGHSEGFESTVFQTSSQDVLDESADAKQVGKQKVVSSALSKKVQQS